MKISISIMAVPERAEHVQKMTQRLAPQIEMARRSGMDIVGTDTFWDTQKDGPWVSWQGAWAYNQKHGSTHHVVLQDDILFCKDFPETIHRLVEARPQDMISGFLPRKSVTQAKEQGLFWVRTRSFLWAQCVLMPVPVGNAALTWISARESENAKEWRRDDDARIRSWLKATNRPVYVAVPHPVEHIGDELGSVMKHNFQPEKRRAKFWLGEDGAGADLAWHNLGYVRE